MNTFKLLKTSFFISIIALFFFSCNKTKIVSNRLTGETWTTVSITIDGQAYNTLPIFKFDKCAIYNEICFGTLQISDTSIANFAWQIRENGKTFEISNQTENTSKVNKEAIDFCASFSGIYTITESKKTLLTMESTSAIGFLGKRVLLTLKKS